MASRKLNSQRKLGFQQLEDRRLMAVDMVAATLAAPKMATAVTPQTPAAQVSAFLAGGVLTINGIAGNDAVTISQPANSPNEFILTSTNGTIFNGSNTRLDFKGVTEDINIAFQGASESLTIGAPSTIPLVSIPANLNINMGNGANSFTMMGTVVKGRMKLTGGAGADSASIGFSRIGVATNNAGANDLTISLGGGYNNIKIENDVSVERDLNILDPSSAGDTITLAEGITAGRYVYINTGLGDGDDYVDLAGVTAGSQLNIQTFGGNDRVFLGGQGLFGEFDPVVADSIYLDLGAGNDLLKVGGRNNGDFGGGIYTQHGDTLLGGAGTDNYWNASFNPVSGVSGFETNNKV